ncbi:IS5 family transposase [Streptomyces hirsutus]
MVLDTQSVRVAAGVPSSTTGRDPAKRVPGRKRALTVDVLGLVIAIAILSANTHDNAAGIALLDQVAEHTNDSVSKGAVRLSEYSRV